MAKYKQFVIVEKMNEHLPSRNGQIPRIRARV